MSLESNRITQPTNSPTGIYVAPSVSSEEIGKNDLLSVEKKVTTTDIPSAIQINQPTSEPTGLYVAPSINIDETNSGELILRLTQLPSITIASTERQEKSYPSMTNEDLKHQITSTLDFDLILQAAAILLVVVICGYFFRR